MPTKNEFREGRQRLRDLMPRARAYLEEHRDMGVTSASAVANSTLFYVREDNLDSLTITRGERGGWIADVHLIKVPAGVASALGTPVQSPHATREAAEESAVLLLAYVLAAARDLPAKPAERVFEFHLINVPLPERIMEKIDSTVAANPDLAWPMPYATARLDQLADELFGGVVTVEKANALTITQKAYFHSTLALASVAGLFRWLPIEPMPVRADANGSRASSTPRSPNP